MRGCHQKSHPAILADLGRPAVALAAFLDAQCESLISPWRRTPSVGEYHGIPNRWEMLGAIAFTHIFQLNRGFDRDCFCL